MYGNPSIHAKLEERPHDWSIEKAPQLYPSKPGLRERMTLATGNLLIVLGKKLVQASKMPPQLTKKPA